MWTNDGPWPNSCLPPVFVCAVLLEHSCTRSFMLHAVYGCFYDIMLELNRNIQKPYGPQQQKQQKPYGPQNLQYLLSGPLLKRFAAPWP